MFAQTITTRDPTLALEYAVLGCTCMVWPMLMYACAWAHASLLFDKPQPPYNIDLNTQ